MGGVQEVPAEIEFHQNAWERFEHAVDVVIKSGPKHKMANLSKASSARRGALKKDKPAAK